MRGIWLVVNHKAIMAKDTYQGFTAPDKAMAYAKGLGWKEEVHGAFDENPQNPHTHMDGKVHVTIQFIPVTA